MMRMVFLVIALAALSASHPQRHYRVLKFGDEATVLETTSDAPLETTSEWIFTDATTTEEIPINTETTTTQDIPTTTEEIPITTETTTTQDIPTTTEEIPITTETTTTQDIPTTTEEIPVTTETTTTQDIPTTTEEIPTTTEEIPTTTEEIPTTTETTTTEKTTTEKTTTEATTTTAIPTTTATPCDPSSIDIYELLSAIQHHIQNIGLDPFEIPDMTDLPFTFHYLLTNHKATLDLTTGWAQDLSSLLLAGPANVTCNSDASLSITLPLIFEDITISWSYQVRSGIYNPAGDMNVINRYVEATATLVRNPATNTTKFQSLEIVNQGIPDITFTSMGVIANAVAEPIDALYKETIFPQFIEEIKNKLLE